MFVSSFTILTLANLRSVYISFQVFFLFNLLIVASTTTDCPSCNPLQCRSLPSNCSKITLDRCRCCAICELGLKETCASFNDDGDGGSSATVQIGICEPGLVCVNSSGADADSVCTGKNFCTTCVSWLRNARNKFILFPHPSCLSRRAYVRTMKTFSWKNLSRYTLHSTLIVSQRLVSSSVFRNEKELFGDNILSS